jgi:hypothetical protein
MISAFGVEHGDFSKSANKALNVFIGAGGTKARQLKYGNLNLAQVPFNPTTRKARQAQAMKPYDKKRVGDIGMGRNPDLRRAKPGLAPRNKRPV